MKCEAGINKTSYIHEYISLRINSLLVWLYSSHLSSSLYFSRPLLCLHSQSLSFFFHFLLWFIFFHLPTTALFSVFGQSARWGTFYLVCSVYWGIVYVSNDLFWKPIHWTVYISFNLKSCCIFYLHVALESSHPQTLLSPFCEVLESSRNRFLSRVNSVWVKLEAPEPATAAPFFSSPLGVCQC